MSEPLGVKASEGINLGDTATPESKRKYEIIITPNDLGINVHIDGWDPFQAQIVLSNAIEAVRKEIMQKSNIIVPGRKGKMQ